MDEKAFNAQINGTRNFYLRRAVERIREGLFHPLGVQWLTSGEEKLNQLFNRGAAALENNFVVSYINLNPRQIPFHDFKEVYRALMGAMVFPNAETSLATLLRLLVKLLDLEQQKAPC
ncbi:hypothetical protein [Desulfobacter sp.]|uniref:hypothetical protein n=1 Tax=Desulfobacter sp. TaxID=2294 RepID=UPI003D13013F